MSSQENAGYAASRPVLLDKPSTQAALGGISRPTLDRLRSRGELAAVLVGRRVFFLADDIANYIARHREESP